MLVDSTIAIFVHAIAVVIFTEWIDLRAGIANNARLAHETPRSRAQASSTGCVDLSVVFIDLAIAIAISSVAHICIQYGVDVTNRGAWCVVTGLEVFRAESRTAVLNLTVDAESPTIPGADAQATGGCFRRIVLIDHPVAVIVDAIAVCVILDG